MGSRSTLRQAQGERIWDGQGERGDWIPAFAGMTEGVAGMAEGDAGMAEGGEGMTEGVVGMTKGGGGDDGRGGGLGMELDATG